MAFPYEWTLLIAMLYQNSLYISLKVGRSWICYDKSHLYM